MNNDEVRSPTTLRKSVRDITLGLGKLPPQAVDLEEAVLGALMLEKDPLTIVVGILRPESFYVEAHQRIFAAIVRLFQESQPVDLLTVTQDLRRTGELEMVGGALYITRLTNLVTSAANVEYHARIISEYAIKRDLIRIGTEMQNDAFEDTTDVFKLLDETEQKIFTITEKNLKRKVFGMTDLMAKAIEALEERRKHEGGLSGVPSGLLALDRVTGGWQKSDLVIIAARPGMGKTALVVSALRNAAVDHTRPVAIFSLEMSSVQLTTRMLSAEAEITSEKIRKAQMEEYEWQALYTKGKRLADAPIFIDDTPALSILEFRAKCRRLKEQHGIELIVVDYLQLMEATTVAKNGGGNREQEIALISRSLKNVAKELQIPVIALSQLSRAVESRGGSKRPQLSDLRESGSIEQDADMVMFIYRPEYYGITELEDGTPAKGYGELIIAKNRHGAQETVKLRFRGDYTRFEDLDTSVPYDAGRFGAGSGSDFTGGDRILPSKMNDGDTPPDSGFRIRDAFEGGDETPF